MVLLRTALAAALCIVAGAASAQPIPAQPRIEYQPVATDETFPNVGPGDEESRPAACRNSWRCPDPMTIDSQFVPAANDIPPPNARPPQRRRGGRVLVLFQNGRIIQLRRRRVTMVGHGFVARPGSAPWMAQIQRPERIAGIQRTLRWDDRQWCGGALIAPGWIVTAAHCLNDNGTSIRSGGYRVRLGLTDINAADGGISYRITEVHAHPNFNRPAGSYSNDIALVRFAADTQTVGARPNWVQPIQVDRIPVENSTIAGQDAFVFGWGLTEHNRVGQPLLAGQIRLDSDHNCTNEVALCGRGIGPRGATQCHGDSGGPLVFWDGQTPRLIGVVSHNRGSEACGSNPRSGVYTRVTSFRAWIEGFTGPLPLPRRPVQRP